MKKTVRRVAIVLLALAIMSVLIVACVEGYVPPTTTTTPGSTRFVDLGQPDSYRVNVYMFTASNGAVIHTCFLAVGPSQIALECP